MAYRTQYNEKTKTPMTPAPCPLETTPSLHLFTALYTGFVRMRKMTDRRAVMSLDHDTNSGNHIASTPAYKLNWRLRNFNQEATLCRRILSRTLD